jgi:hypothetical protein
MPGAKISGANFVCLSSDRATSAATNADTSKLETDLVMIEQLEAEHRRMQGLWGGDFRRRSF